MRHNIGVIGPDGEPQFEKTRFYPVMPFLDLLRRVERDVGKQMAYDLGLAVVRHFPRDPSMTDIRSALERVDRSAHMSLRLDGKPMMTPEGELVEGWGHTRAVEIAARSAVIHYSGPASCEFERGALTGEMQRFELRAQVSHERTPLGCRRKGARTCVFNVSW
jgi:predicted hydrocarbon binding protein